MASIPLPRLEEDTAFFWTGGADGELRIQRCRACGTYAHPPSWRCRTCGSVDLAPEAVSGRGTVFAYTVNRQPFLDAYPPPYTLAIVELVEQEALQLTTRIVGCECDDVHVGLPVSVGFERYDEVYLPVFAPEPNAPPGNAEVSLSSGSPTPRPRRRAVRGVDDHFERRAVIAGIGMSQVGRRLGRGALELTVESALAAVADAGLELADIDGLVTWPGEMAASAGFTGPSVFRVTDALSLDLTWHSSCWEGPGQFNAVMNAALAVASGLARHVLVYRTLTEATGQRGRGRSAEHAVDAGGVTGPLQWMRPFGSVSAANWLAPRAQRYLRDFGATREQIGWLPVTLREHAIRNPTAIFRTPLTLDDYLDARMVSDPLGLYDCDIPIDGSVAIVVSTSEYAVDAPSPVRIEAIGSGQAGRPYWDQWREPTDMAARYASQHLWARTDLTPEDVDTAQLYDGFSYLALVWLESLGFCGPGEAASFVEGGKRIRFDGQLPLNTGGGQLSGGRLHAFGLLHEACLQLRDQAGDRQVPGADVAVTAGGGGPLGGCLLLTRS
jgi:acetyl-CoA acetyltransferase/uncharacterized OB-fold protein